MLQTVYGCSCQDLSIFNALPSVSIKRCRLTSVIVPIVKMKKSYDCFVYTMGIPLPKSSYIDTELYVPNAISIYVSGIIKSSQTNYLWINIRCIKHILQMYTNVQKPDERLSRHISKIIQTICSFCVFPSFVPRDSAHIVQGYLTDTEIIVKMTFTGMGWV